jgi:hypothetical protein
MKDSDKRSENRRRDGGGSRAGGEVTQAQCEAVTHKPAQMPAEPLTMMHVQDVTISTTPFRVVSCE